MADICKKVVGAETMAAKMALTNKHKCSLPKNLAGCILDVQMAQEGYVSYNENAVEMAIEQGKMAYEKAYELQQEAEKLIQDAECTLEQRANIHALLAVAAATALVC